MKIVKKITLRDLYRRAGQIAKEAQKGVEFEVYSRKEPIFNIYASKSKSRSENKNEVLRKYKGAFKGKIKHTNLSDDELIYG